MMFAVESSVGSPTVVTSTDGGLSAEQITVLCCNKIVQVSESAAPEIKEQAAVFRREVLP